MTNTASKLNILKATRALLFFLNPMIPKGIVRITKVNFKWNTPGKNAMPFFAIKKIPDARNKTESNISKAIVLLLYHKYLSWVEKRKNNPLTL
jgi:hypothetical protein